MKLIYCLTGNELFIMCPSVCPSVILLSDLVQDPSLLPPPCFHPLLQSTLYLSNHLKTHTPGLNIILKHFKMMVCSRAACWKWQMRDV